jgi:hypothetical protein
MVPSLRSVSTLSTARRTLAALLLATASACSAAEDLAGLGQETNNSNNVNSGGGSATLTLWTSDSSPSPIAISVDGTVVGTLTQYRTAAPTCGAPTSGGAISVKVSAGSHVVSARETADTGTWPAKTVSVSSGGCLTYEFTP